MGLIRDGFDGYPEDYPDGGVINLTRPLVRNIAHLGGTILGTSNHGNPFKTRVPQPDGSFTEIARSDEVLRRLFSDFQLMLAAQAEKDNFPDARENFRARHASHRSSLNGSMTLLCLGGGDRAGEHRLRQTGRRGSKPP